MMHKSKITPATSPLFCNHPTLLNITLLLILCYNFECVTFQIFKPDMWPPNNPDLFPVDYAVCDAL